MSVKTIGRLYVPSRLLTSVKSPTQVVLKNACAAVPFDALAPDAKVASLPLMAAKVPPTAVDQARSLIGFTPEFAPA